MNDNVKKLVEHAGFATWEDEEWAPKGAFVDWSCNYDVELEALIRLVVDRCVSICEEGSPTQSTSSGAAEKIKYYFEENTIDIEKELDNE